MSKATLMSILSSIFIESDKDQMANYMKGIDTTLKGDMERESFIFGFSLISY